MSDREPVELDLGTVTSYGLARENGFVGSNTAWVKKIMANATEEAGGRAVPAFVVGETAAKEAVVTNTNVETTDITGTKIWVDDGNADGTRPAGGNSALALQLWRSSAAVPAEPAGRSFQNAPTDSAASTISVASYRAAIDSSAS